MQNENFYANVNLDPMIDLDALIRQEQIDRAHEEYLLRESAKPAYAPLLLP